MLHSSCKSSNKSDLSFLTKRPHTKKVLKEQGVMFHQRPWKERYISTIAQLYVFVYTCLVSLWQYSGQLWTKQLKTRLQIKLSFICSSCDYFILIAFSDITFPSLFHNSKHCYFSLFLYLKVNHQHWLFPPLCWSHCKLFSSLEFQASKVSGLPVAIQKTCKKGLKSSKE